MVGLDPPCGSKFTERTFCILLLYWPTGTKPERERYLPLETWSEIFEEVCSGDAATFFDYNQSRDKLCLCHGEWEGFIRGQSCFWTKLSIDCETSASQIERHMRSVCSRPIDVNIIFDVNDVVTPVPVSPNRSGIVAPSDVENLVRRAAACLVAALPSVPLWRRVCVWSSSNAFTVVVFDVLGPVCGLEIISLFLATPSYALDRGSMSPWDSPRAIFAGGAPKLVDLQLIAVALPWSAPLLFAGLETLDLADIPRLASPTASQFIALLTSATSLTILVISGSCVLPEPSEDVQGFALPVLQSLKLRHRSNNVDTLKLLCAAEMPDLVDLEVCDFNEESWDAALSMNVFHQLLRLTICGAVHTTHVAVLLPRLDNLFHLDVRATPSCYLNALIENPRWCPALRRISVGDVHIGTIYTFVLLRRRMGETYEIRQVDYFHKETATEEFAWIAGQLFCWLECFIMHNDVD